MLKRIIGTPVREKIELEISNMTKRLDCKNIVPTIATIRVGNNAGDIYYEKSIIKKSKKYGICCKTFIYKDGIEQNILENNIKMINSDDSIHGIILLMPFPKYIDSNRIKNIISFEKDVDAITDSSLAALLSGNEKSFHPCTAESCMEILKYYGYNLQGKKVAIIGRSLRVGKPLLLMMMNKNATVTVCHTKTLEKDSIEICKNADIVILATGQTEYFGNSFFRNGQVVIDVGTGIGADGKIAGDLDVNNIISENEISEFTYSPVPGGVGTVTTAILLRNVVTAAERGSAVAERK